MPLVALVLATLYFELQPRPANAPPVWRGGLPLVGHFIEFSGNPVATILRGYKEMGPAFTMRFLGFNMTFLVGWKAHSPFFAADDDQLSQNEPYKFMTPIFGKGIVFDAPKETRRQQLNFITHAFLGNAYRTSVRLIVAEAEQYFRENWGDSGEADLLDAMSNLTILTASRCLLGREIREHMFKEFWTHFKAIDEGINPLAIFFPNLPLPAFKCVRCLGACCPLAALAAPRTGRRCGWLPSAAAPVPPRARSPSPRLSPPPAPPPPRPAPPRLPPRPRRRRDEARAAIAKLFGGVISARRAATEKALAEGKGASLPDDMLQHFIQARYDDDSCCSDDQIVGLLIGTLFAGQHTSSISSSWTILHLLHNPALMARAMGEVVSVYGGNTDPAATEPITFEAVKGFKLLRRCMKESLRMSPPLIMLMRKVYTPLPVLDGKFEVPVDHLVFAPLASSMNLPTEAPDCAFPDPATFNPDRFEALEADRSPAARYKFCAFGGGIHQCRGEEFGITQVLTIVSLVLRKYELTALGPLPKPNHQAMVVGPMQANGACRVRYQLRKTPLPAAPALVAAAAAPAAGAGAGARRAASPSRATAAAAAVTAH